MSGPQFFETGMGKKYYDGTMPRIAKALEAIAKALEVKGVEAVLDTKLAAIDAGGAAMQEIRNIFVDPEHGVWKQNLSGADVIEAVSRILATHGWGGRGYE